MKDGLEEAQNVYLPGNIRLLRKLKKLSQQKLAEHLGLKRNNIATYESGIVEPNAQNFLKIARFFNIPPRQLLFKDLSGHNRWMAGGDENPDLEEKKKEELLLYNALIKRTQDIQTILDGLNAFHQMKVQDAGNFHRETEPGHAEQADLARALKALEELTEINWQFIREMQKDS